MTNLIKFVIECYDYLNVQFQLVSINLHHVFFIVRFEPASICDLDSSVTLTHLMKNYIMLKNGQMYVKNLVVFTTKHF